VPWRAALATFVAFVTAVARLALGEELTVVLEELRGRHAG
jgi:hypothetical protein